MTSYIHSIARPPPLLLLLLLCTLHRFNYFGFATECQAWCLALPQGRLFLRCLQRKGTRGSRGSEGIGSLTPVTSTLLHLAPLPHIRIFHVTAQHVIMSGHRAWEIQLLPLCQTSAIILMYAIVMFLKSEKMCLLVPSLFFRPVSHLHFNLCVLDRSWSCSYGLPHCWQSSVSCSTGWWVANATDIGSDCLILSGIMVQTSLWWIMENLEEKQHASQMPNRMAIVTVKCC